MYIPTNSTDMVAAAAARRSVHHHVHAYGCNRLLLFVLLPAVFGLPAWDLTCGAWLLLLFDAGPPPSPIAPSLAWRCLRLRGSVCVMPLRTALRGALCAAFDWEGMRIGCTPRA